jgi:predicted Zn-dependent protease
MGASNKEKQAEWLSTHPSGEARIYEMQRNMLDALILYAKAKNTTVDRLPEYRP